MLIDQRAGNIAQQLALHGIGGNGRSVSFVAHSMGGLIVKSLIVRGWTRGNAEHRAPVEAVRGIVFCGTPHRGSDFASAAGRLGRYSASAVTSMVGGSLGWKLGDWLWRRLGTQAHVREMEANAVPFDLLHDDFLAWCRARGDIVAVESLAETIGSATPASLGTRPRSRSRGSASLGESGHRRGA